jgi:hypothetical protein
MIEIDVIKYDEFIDSIMQEIIDGYDIDGNSILNKYPSLIDYEKSNKALSEMCDNGSIVFYPVSSTIISANEEFEYDGYVCRTNLWKQMQIACVMQYEELSELEEIENMIIQSLYNHDKSINMQVNYITQDDDTVTFQGEKSVIIFNINLPIISEMLKKITVTKQEVNVSDAIPEEAIYETYNSNFNLPPRFNLY